jgi:hypothetical protein
MVNEIKISKRLERMRKEVEVIERQKREFLENILNTAKSEFEKYERGYKVFSIAHSNRSYFSLDDNTVSTIINTLADSYKCKLNSLAISQPPLSNKVYTLVFEK